MKRDIIVFLDDILDSIDLILDYSKDVSEEEFFKRYRIINIALRS